MERYRPFFRCLDRALALIIVQVVNKGKVGSPGSSGLNRNFHRTATVTPPGLLVSPTLRTIGMAFPEDTPGGILQFT
jgi:hypothetical protein